MKKAEIINWIIFFVLHYSCFIVYLTVQSDISLKYSGVCQGDYGLYLGPFDPSKDTIFWFVAWHLLIYGMIAFIQAGVVTVVLLIMGLFERAETIMKFLLWDMGSKKQGELHMQSFPWISVLYLIVSLEIFRNITIFFFCGHPYYFILDIFYNFIN